MSTVNHFCPDCKCSDLNSDDEKHLQKFACRRSPQDLVESVTHLIVAYTTYSMSHRILSNQNERVLESLQQKDDRNNGMSSGEESDLYRQL